MDLGTILGSILHEIIINIAADELQELIKRLLSGEELDAMAQGNTAANAMIDAFTSHGVDASLMTENDWAALGQMIAAI